MATSPSAESTDDPYEGPGFSSGTGRASLTIPDLVLRIQAGDREAEGILVDRFTRGLFGYLRRIGCPQELAEDLHQETFRIALERLRGRGLKEPAGFAGFLRGIARNLRLAEGNKAARRRTGSDEEALARTTDPRSGQLRQVLDSEAAELVRGLLGEMEKTRDRQILYRFYLAEDRKESICDDLDLSTKHFNRVLFRARQRFRELLEGFEKRQSLQRVT